MSQRPFEPPDDDVIRAGHEAVGELIRRARFRNGWTQRQLGALCGIDQAVISRLENGQQRGLSWRRFGRLVATLGGLGPSNARDAPDSHHAEALAPTRSRT
jgi:DNA-binding XRE family transcriptional regulator